MRDTVEHGLELLPEPADRRRHRPPTSMRNAVHVPRVTGSTHAIPFDWLRRPTAQRSASSRSPPAGHERSSDVIAPERDRRLLLRHCRRYLPEARAEDALQQALEARPRARRCAAATTCRPLRPWLLPDRPQHRAQRPPGRPGYDYAEELREILVSTTLLPLRRAAEHRGGRAPYAGLSRRDASAPARGAAPRSPSRGRSAGGGYPPDLCLSTGGAVPQLVHRARTSPAHRGDGGDLVAVATWLCHGGRRPRRRRRPASGSSDVLARAPRWPRPALSRCWPAGRSAARPWSDEIGGYGPQSPAAVRRAAPRAERSERPARSSRGAGSAVGTGARPVRDLTRPCACWARAGGPPAPSRDARERDGQRGPRKAWPVTMARGGDDDEARPPLAARVAAVATTTTPAITTRSAGDVPDRGAIAAGAGRRRPGPGNSTDGQHQGDDGAGGGAPSGRAWPGRRPTATTAARAAAAAARAAARADEDDDARHRPGVSPSRTCRDVGRWLRFATKKLCAGLQLGTGAAPDDDEDKGLLYNRGTDPTTGHRSAGSIKGPPTRNEGLPAVSQEAVVKPCPLQSYQTKRLGARPRRAAARRAVRGQRIGDVFHRTRYGIPDRWEEKHYLPPAGEPGPPRSGRRRAQGTAWSGVPRPARPPQRRPRLLLHRRRRRQAAAPSPPTPTARARPSPSSPAASRLTAAGTDHTEIQCGCDDRKGSHGLALPR